MNPDTLTAAEYATRRSERLEQLIALEATRRRRPPIRAIVSSRGDRIPTIRGMARLYGIGKHVARRVVWCGRFFAGRTWWREGTAGPTNRRVAESGSKRAGKIPPAMPIATLGQAISGVPRVKPSRSTNRTLQELKSGNGEAGPITMKEGQ